VTFRSSPPERQSFLMQLFISSFPILLLIGVWVYFMRQMQGGGGGPRRHVLRQEPGAPAG
jgi:cell division protease FtsH